MKMKKLLGVALAATAMIMMTACAKSTDSTTKSSEKATTSEKESTADNTKALEKIKEKGELVMGTSPDFPPFEFPTSVDGANKIVGTDIDIAQAIADDLGVKLKVMELSFDNLLPSLQQGKLDVVLAGVSATAKRQKNADFSDPYYTPEQKIVVKKADLDKYTSADSFKDKKITAQKGSIQEDVAKEQLASASLISIQKTTTMLIQLKQGAIDGIVLEGGVAENYVKVNTDLAIANVELTSADDEKYAVALPKNSGDLTTEVNKVIEKLIADGKIDEFLTKNTELSEESAK